MAACPHDNHDDGVRLICRFAKRWELGLWKSCFVDLQLSHVCSEAETNAPSSNLAPVGDRAGQLNRALVAALILSRFNHVALIGLLALNLTSPVASGAEFAQSARERPARFATVWRIRGEVTTTIGETSSARALRAGDPVFVGETIRAKSTGEAVLRTDDAGIVAVRPGAIFVVDRFSADGHTSDHLSLQLAKRALRMITGWIGRINRAEHRVFTATATIGVRGTDHEPYVMSADLAQTLRQKEGTYDKVNRGGTTMEVKGNRLDIDAGRVEFVRSAPELRIRGLLTLLLPVLLDSVPDFYVPGEFDAELDALSPINDAEALRALEERRKSTPAPSPGALSSRPPPTSIPGAPMPGPVPAPSAKPRVIPPGPASPTVHGDYDARTIAQTWLDRFDTAVATRNVLMIVRLFAPEVTVRANVRGNDGTTTTVEMGRDELAQSTVEALKGLTD
jgi:hypothetical protein